jgi:CheY-like chemotaxis protein
MSRILLADDSPHAQRMGERILREEGFEVVTVTDGSTALLRLRDVDPDLVLADISLPGKSGYEICRTVKQQSGHSHVRVVLTAGLLEPFDDAMAASAKCDAVLKKPFESSVVLDTIRPLIEAAKKDKSRNAAANGPVADIAPPVSEPESEPTVEMATEPIRRPLSVPMSRNPFVAIPVRVVREPVEETPPPPTPVAAESAMVQQPPAVPVGVRQVATPAPATAPAGLASVTSEHTAEHTSEDTSQQTSQHIEAERIRAAVTLALDAALPKMIDEITQRVLIALGH